MSSLYEMTRDGVAVTDDMRESWYSSGSMTRAGEFKQHLHVFDMVATDHGENISSRQHRSYPWVNLWPRPDIEDLTAYWHMTEFKMLPLEWTHFWLDLAALRATKKSHGPYWMLLDKPHHAHCAQVLVQMKRRLTNELSRQVTSRGINMKVFDQAIIDALEPFRVLTPQQEIADEAHRSSEGRGAAVSVRYSDTSGRPPRCR